MNHPPGAVWTEIPRHDDFSRNGELSSRRRGGRCTSRRHRRRRRRRRRRRQQTLSCHSLDSSFSSPSLRLQSPPVSSLSFALNPSSMNSTRGSTSVHPNISSAPPSPHSGIGLTPAHGIPLDGLLGERSTQV